MAPVQPGDLAGGRGDRRRDARRDGLLGELRRLPRADATGGVGPSLVGSGLTDTEVASVVAVGRGVMPPGLVEGQEAADVAAYVASLEG